MVKFMRIVFPGTGIKEEGKLFIKLQSYLKHNVGVASIEGEF